MLTTHFSINQNAALVWLHRVCHWSADGKPTYELACIVSALLVANKEEAIVKKCVDVLLWLCRSDPEQVGFRARPIRFF